MIVEDKPTMVHLKDWVSGVQILKLSTFIVFATYFILLSNTSKGNSCIRNAQNTILELTNLIK